MLSMKDFIDAALGRAANDLALANRDFNREIRALQPKSSPPLYSKGQTAAAQYVIRDLAIVDKEFSDCRLSVPMQYCECCNDPDFLKRLAATRPAELDEDDVANVAESLLYTLGSTEDFAYFVPRFCSDSLGYPLYDVEMVFGRFQLAGYFEWPESRRVAVRNFVLSHWRFALLTAQHFDARAMADPFFVILDCLASLGEIDAAIQVWSNTHDVSSDERLLQLVGRLDFEDDYLGIIGVGGYSNTGQQYALLENWINSQPARERIGSIMHSREIVDQDRTAHVLRNLAVIEQRAARPRRVL